MGFLDNLRGTEESKSSAKELYSVLSTRDETLALIEPVTRGLISYRLSNEEIGSKVLAAGYVPNSFESYQRFIELDPVNSSFPHKQVANDYDAQLLANNVREEASSDHGVSILAAMDGSSNQKVFIGLNLNGQQVGVFKEEINFRQKNIEKKISEFVLKKLISELNR